MQRTQILEKVGNWVETLSIIQFKGWQNASVVMVPVHPSPSYPQRPCKQGSRKTSTHVEQMFLTLKLCDVQNSLSHLANHFVSLHPTRFFFGSSLLHWSESQSWCTGLELSLSQTVDASVILSRGWDTQGKCSYWLTAVWSSGRRSV